MKPTITSFSFNFFPYISTKLLFLLCYFVKMNNNIIFFLNIIKLFLKFNNEMSFLDWIDIYPNLIIKKNILDENVWETGAEFACVNRDLFAVMVSQQNRIMPILGNYLTMKAKSLGNRFLNPRNSDGAMAMESLNFCQYVSLRFKPITIFV